MEFDKFKKDKHLSWGIVETTDQSKIHVKVQKEWQRKVELDWSKTARNMHAKR